MGIFERYLSAWVALAIALGVLLGNYAPGIFAGIAKLQIANVNIIVAALIWVMIFPMMLQVDLSKLHEVKQKPQGLYLTVIINWLVKPFTMALLAWLFFKVFFANLVDPSDATEYIAGMILLGIAPCTAMVFVWSQLTKGCANYTLVQVTVNDVILIFAFAPLAALLLGMADIFVPWSTLLLSVILYALIPLAAGLLVRHYLLQKSEKSLQRFLAACKPGTVIGLLLTVVLLFAFQAQTILSQPYIILLIAIPLIIQTYLIFTVAYLWAWRWKLPHEIAAPAAMISTSNFFELAVAVAIGLFGLQSGAALATVVGVLVEVPLMLSLVWFANRMRPLMA